MFRKRQLSRIRLNDRLRSKVLEKLLRRSIDYPTSQFLKMADKNVNAIQKSLVLNKHPLPRLNEKEGVYHAENIDCFKRLANDSYCSAGLSVEIC